jgi:hypothetical protein
MDRVRSKFEAIADCTVYKDQADGCADEPHSVEAGTPIWAAVNGSETRTLDRKLVKVVLLNVGGSNAWCWMPRDEFLRSTRKIEQKPLGPLVKPEE